MIIIPFTHTIHAVSDQLNLHTINILCEGGYTPWTEDNQPIQDVLQPNDIYEKTIENIQTCYYVNVDVQKTDIRSMYMWNEIDPIDRETLCWRSFMIFVNPDKTIWLSMPDISLTPLIPYLHVILKTYCDIYIDN